MADIFSSPRQMLRNAKRHLANLEIEINRFGEEKPWAYVIEDDPDSPTKIHKVKFTKQLSEFLPGIVFDCANNLRPVLDQTAFAIAVRHTRNSRPKSAKFPFGPDELHMLNNLSGGCKDLPTEIRDLFKSFKPYKGGNNALWALNELCNVPKHMLLYPVRITGGSTHMQPTPGKNLIIKPGPGEMFELHAPRWDREKYELVFARVPASTEFSADFHVTFTVAFDDVDEVIRGQNPVAVLSVMAREVEEVLNLSETMCKAIGLI